ncbi:MAG: hypothetical protein H9855_11770 [Candidatus Acinetobacter avistercoris]|nr:hypothetical protein [Candidatus Acinetobacter avistercoris]
MQIPPIIRDNLLSAIVTAILVSSATYFLTLKFISEPKIENLESRNKDLNNDKKEYLNDINNLDKIKESLRQKEIEVSKLELVIARLKEEEIFLNQSIVNIKAENEELKEKVIEFKNSNLDYIESEVKSLKKEKYQIRNPSGVQIIYGGKSSSKELSPVELALEGQIQSQINNLQSKLMCTN